MSAVLTILLVGLALIQNQTVEQPKPKPRPRVERYEFSSFGDRALSRCQIVARARAASVMPGGRGVCVVRFEVEESLIGDEKTKVVTVLAAPGEFTEKSSYVLFLERFHGGDRFTAIGRVPEAERDFEAKLRVLRQYVEAEKIEDSDQRELKIRSILLENIGDRNLFVKWNALTELDAFVAKRLKLFGPREKARIVSAYNAEASPTYREGLQKILERLGIRFEEKKKP